ncbi:MAG TPA: OmpH family outer membrane protein [Candidatus Saccharimonadales bacterium]|nr:OmpH family outer membrane protein [Candidatus Saccharimonadales bacterium]
MNFSKSSLFFSLAALLCITDISAELKIAVISEQKIMTESESGKNVLAKIQSEQEKLAKPLQEEEKKLQAKAQKLQADDEAFQKDRAEFQKNGNMLKEDAQIKKIDELKERQQKIEDDKEDFPRLVKKLQEAAKNVEPKMQAVAQKEMSAFMTLVKDTIKEVSQREGWDILYFEETLAYVNPSLVKNKVVFEALDKKVKAANQAKKEAAEKAAAAKK